MSTLDGDQIFNESNNRYNYIKWKEYKSIFTSIFVHLSRENLFYEASPIWGKSNSTSGLQVTKQKLQRSISCVRDEDRVWRDSNEA